MSDIYFVGEVVRLTFLVTNPDTGLPANATAASLTVTLLGGSSTNPTLTNSTTGTYYNDYVPAAVGRYVAVAVFTGTNAGTQVTSFDVITTGGGLVTLADAKTYLGTTSWTDPEIQSALDAERAAQAAVCRIDEYTADLKEALLRRVARNLAARGVPIAQYSAFEGGGGTVSRVPLKDPEIARLEAPHRRWTVG